ncbi:M1 family metallopeptidase [Salibacter halophilus]|uniref:M1 family metallopeptidase n=1 Tax=Salibacter halophilus TaxID=1803916 RepID=A0A6N6M4J0_9FLAO|nr:M1 family metallopeptidase [Salibacter halophilus]KAB1064389.1 M1 family metallopeptidase [Salibacter halophilus]
MRNIFYTLLGLLALTFSVRTATAQYETYNNNKFKQLKEELPTPNVYRTASGAPGHEYYQQQADYEIEVTLDDENQTITGKETITYYNNSPDDLNYLWVQLDQNVRARDSQSKKIRQRSMNEKMSFGGMKRMMNDFDGGFKISSVKTNRGTKLDHTINYTMMRIDLPETLESGHSYTFQIEWNYNINNRMEIGGRSGYEYFEKDSNYLYTIAQFYPRMAVYNDVEGWQNKQFLGRGEFALPFGDYDVKITVPADHIVGSTGVLQNDRDVLTSKQRNRFEEARESDSPVLIVTEEEAIENEKEGTSKTKTWHFEAENVRDFAFATSRKFIWDAQGVDIGGKRVMAMSYYPKEGNPLWERYSTKVVAHTVKTYSKYTIDYPYPVAISVNSKRIGMEYPMICFNYGRPEEDGTYSERLKYGMISVIVHEVGHNFFPMIINSDERQWTWMDEGLNSFVQYLTEQEWERNYPSRRGPAYKIVNYMKGDKSYQTPIMTNSESIFQFGNNAYGKPATALNILRETVMGRELFDYAFKTYAERWAFKHPTPADFFRTMEDASAVDLDWFWRGWFYTTAHVDIAINDVKWYKVETGDPRIDNPIARKMDDADEKYIANQRNAKSVEKTITEKDTATADFYNRTDEYDYTSLDVERFKEYTASLNEEEKAMLDTNMNFYEMEFELVGELPMPIVAEFSFLDGSKEKIHIPAEIWRMGDEKVSKVFWFEKKLVGVEVDPNLETADVDRNNNYWPARNIPSRFELFKKQQRGSPKNRMQRFQEAEER